MIVDTAFLIDLMDGVPEAVQMLEKLKSHTIFVTTPTIFELWSGLAESLHPEREEQKIRMVVDSQLILELNKEGSEEGGYIHGTLWKKGMPIDAEDCMIAGIAKHYGEKVLTRNVKHFERIKGLSIETY